MQMILYMDIGISAVRAECKSILKFVMSGRLPAVNTYEA